MPGNRLEEKLQFQADQICSTDICFHVSQDRDLFKKELKFASYIQFNRDLYEVYASIHIILTALVQPKSVGNILTSGELHQMHCCALLLK